MQTVNKVGLESGGAKCSSAECPKAYANATTMFFKEVAKGVFEPNTSLLCMFFKVIAKYKMEKIKIPYSIFYDFNVIKAAHIHARRSKRAKLAIVKFELAELENLKLLQNEMQSRTYKIGPYYKFYVTEPKARQIQSISYRDRIVQHILCDEVLSPHFSRKIIYDNAACIEGKGQFFAFKRMKLFMKKFWHLHGVDGWFLKCDIAKFFPSLSHEVIKQNMSSEIEDPDIRALFDGIIDSYSTPKEFLIKNNIPTTKRKYYKNVGWKNVEIERGVPIGNQTSQIVGLYYLNPIDRFVKEVLKVKYYIRYMDDFILLHHSKEFLIEALKKIRAILRDDLKLELNSKTQLVPIKNGLKFIGFHFYLKEDGRVVTRAQRRVLKKFGSRVKMINKYYPHEYLSTERALSILASYRGHLKHSNSKGFGNIIRGRLKVKIEKEEASVYAKVFSPISE